METLGKLLEAVVTSEGEPKEEVWQKVRELKDDELFAVHLTQLILDQNRQLEVRLMAASIVKRIVDVHLNSSDEGFLPPDMDARNKERIKTLLLTGLLEPDEKVRMAVSVIISTIVRCDLTINWAGLVGTLVGYLNGENEFGIHGALLVLDEIRFDPTDVNFTHDCSLIFCQMNRILAAENQYSLEIRCQACDIFYSVLSDMVEHKEPAMIRRYLQPAVSRFSATAMSIWTSKKSSISLKMKILKQVEELLSEVPRCIFDFLTNMLPLVWETLIECAVDYRANFVNEYNKPKSVADKVDKDSMDLLEMILEFIENSLYADRKNFAGIPEFKLSRLELTYLQDSLTLPHVLRHLMTLLELSAYLVKKWDTDVENFLEYERDEIADSEIRRHVENLMMTGIWEKKIAFRDSLTMMIMKQLEAENVTRVHIHSAGSGDSWQSHEAVLLAFGALKESIISKKHGESPRYDVVPILKNIVLADLNNPACHPLLVARCLCLGGLYADLMPLELATAFLEATVNSLQENQPACVKVCAAEAVRSWYGRGDSGKGKIADGRILRSNVPALFEGLFSLVGSSKSERVHTLVLRSIAALIPCRRAFTSSIASRIYSLAEIAMLEYRTGYFFHDPCIEVFRELLLVSNCVQLVQERLVPALLRMMTPTRSNNCYRESENGNTALEVANVLVKHSPVPLSNLIIDILFPASCKYITSSYNACIARGISITATYLDTSFKQVVRYSDEKGINGAQHALRIFIHMLNQRHLEHVADVCRSMIMLITDAWNKLKGNVDELFRALLNGLRNGRYHPKREQNRQCLLLVYAHILNTDFDSVFKFFTSEPSSDGWGCPFEFVLSEGFCREYNSFHGKEGKTVELALSKILRHGLMDLSSRLHQITFKDDSGKTIPLLAKICQLTMIDPVPAKPSNNRQP